MELNELDNYDMWQLERFGDILPKPEVMPNGEIDSEGDDLDRLSQWREMQNAIQSME